MEKIRKISNGLLLLLRVYLILFIVFQVLQWGFLRTEFVQSLVAQGLLLPPFRFGDRLVSFEEVQWTALTQGLAFLGSLVESFPLLMGLYLVQKIFLKYRQGSIFTVENAKHYRSLGFLFFVHAFLAKPLGFALLILGVTLNQPPGERVLSLSFGTGNMNSIILGLLVIVISWVMQEGSRLEEEQRLVV